MLSSVLHVTILGGFRWYPVTEKYIFWFLIWGGGGWENRRESRLVGWTELDWIVWENCCPVPPLFECIYVCVCLYVNPSHCLKCKFALIIRSFSSAFYGVLFCSFRSLSSFFFIKLCGYCWVFLWYFGVFFWSFSVSLVISGGIIWWHVCVGVVFMSWLMGFKFPPKVTIHPSSPSSSLTKLKMEKFSLFSFYTVRSNMAFSFVVFFCVSAGPVCYPLM